MRRKVILAVCLLIVLAIIGVVFVLPLMDREMMKAPLSNGLMALCNGDMRALRSVFTRDANLEYAQETIAITTVLAENRTAIETKELNTSMRFAGLTNMRRESDVRVSADFSIIVYYTGDENPYPRMPIEKMGHVVLYHQGFMDWKIEKLRLQEPEVSELLR